MKFLTLLKKEVKELLTIQTIISMAFMLILFSFLGDAVGGVIEDAVNEQSGEVVIYDEDKTDFTSALLTQIKESGYTVTVAESIDADRAKMLEANDTDYLILIPKGFTQRITVDMDTAELEYIGRMNTSSIFGSLESSDSETVVSMIRTSICSLLLTGEYNVPAEKLDFIYQPVNVKEVSVVRDKSAEVGLAQLIGYTMSQSVVVPVVLFVLVLMASQMIVNAIATEKIDKTLETLLSAPVSRISVLGAKMTAAAIVALLNAVVYMIGFSKYMNGMIGVESLEAVAGETADSSAYMEQLGLTLGVKGYVLLGLQMFMSILIALSVSLILGALVNDAKQTQTVILPIMFLTLIPYMLSIFIDINTVEPAVIRWAAWAIPFTHTFTAMNNIMFGNMTIYWCGLIYQFLFLLISMFFAVKLFTSDKIFTISLNFGQKRKLRRFKK